MKIEFRNITKTFNKGSAEQIKALDANLVIPFSQFVVVVGSNGSGKSTLLNVLAGTVTPDSGSLWLDGKEVSGKTEFAMSRLVARVFQNPLSGTAPGLTIVENFRLAALRTQKKLFKIGITNSFKKQLKDKLAMLNLGLENKLEQEVGSLSGGQRQALALLMATMDKPAVLLLDEPSAALDPHTSTVIMELAEKVIREYRLTAILVTHSIKDALKYGDRLICMHEGHLVKDLMSEDKMKLQLNDVYSWFDT